MTLEFMTFTAGNPPFRRYAVLAVNVQGYAEV